MIINKKMYNERVARQVFIFISNTSADSKSSLYFGLATNRENRNEENKMSTLS
jgi:hypothetical protein